MRMSRYAEHELRDAFFDSLDIFNDALDSGITRENTVLAFFTPDNGLAVYEQFCRKYFPKHLDEDYRAEGYFQSFAAQAFAGGGRYGVMVRADMDIPLPELHRIFLHEISHLFCWENEIEGGGFFDRYCMGSGAEDGMMNAGYAIWREAVADIMADSILSEYASLTLADIREEAGRLYRLLSPAEPESKKCMALIIVYVMITKEVGGAAEWDKAEAGLKRHLRLDDPLLYAILKMVFDNLHRSPFRSITPEFIMGLGETYLSLLSVKYLRENII